MRIRHISIAHLRGIKRLEWHVPGGLVCLVGPGDSTKTTILDAIEMALAPRWFVPFTPADFHEGVIDTPIRVEVCVSELPNELCSEGRFGLYQRGYTPGQPIADDPADGQEPVLTIRLEVRGDLEPEWTVVKDSMPQPKPISWRDRERLGVARLGADIDRHLTWGRGSALGRLCDDTGASQTAAAIAARAAREAIAGASMAEFDGTLSAAKSAMKVFGVGAENVRPGLDLALLTFGTGALALHDGNVPLRYRGLGTRRLIALALQNAGLGGGSIILVDEIEHGLEPHRIRGLLRSLRRIKLGDGAAEQAGRGQIIMTTHSPTPIVELSVESLGFVRSEGGVTAVQHVAVSDREALQGVTRAHPLALLARRVVVCEGKTEVGLCRALDEHLAPCHDNVSFASAGVVAVDGSGRTNAPTAAIALSGLGYPVAYLGDSDKPMSPGADEVKKAGVSVFVWPDNCCTEQRIATDLPLEGLQELLDAAIQLHGEPSVVGSIKARLSNALALSGPIISRWLASGVNEQDARGAIGKAAHEKGWFKDVGSGEALGQIVAANLPKIATSPLASEIARLEEWVYEQ